MVEFPRARKTYIITMKGDNNMRKIKDKIEAIKAPTNQVKVGEFKDLQILKSVRIYIERNLVKLDYYTNEDYRPNGKKRFRFSTKEEATARNLKKYEMNKWAYAQSHFAENYQVRNEEDNVYFEDIGLLAIEESKNEVAKYTYKAKVSIYNRHILPYFKGKLIEQLKTKDIKHWKNTILSTGKISQSNFNKIYGTLKQCLDYAVDNEYITHNVVMNVDKKSKLFKPVIQRYDKNYYTLDESKDMLKKSDGLIHMIILIGLHTGMRIGEIIGLQYSDIDFENRTIRIQRSIRNKKIKDTTKTGVNRTINMSQTLKDALIKYQAIATNDKWIFIYKDNKPFDYSDTIVQSHFKPFLKRIGVSYRTLYALRHSFASNLILNDVNINYISKMLGHSNISITSKYYIKSHLPDSIGESPEDKLFS